MSSELELLYEQIQQLSANSARFRRVALHVHSPQSYDFAKKQCDEALNEKQQYLKEGGEQAYLKHFVGRYDIVAITDHMRIDYACRVAAAARSFPDICVLPGMEVNVRLAPPLHELKMHIIVIFPETITVSEVERIFPPKFQTDDKREGNEEIKIGSSDSCPDLAKFVEKIKKNDGLCIAAHVDNNNGVRLLFRQTGKETLELFSPEAKITPEQQRDLSEKFKDFLLGAKFHGIEVSKSEDRKHYCWEAGTDGSVFRIPVILTFDAHDIETVQDSSRLTYIKTTNLSWKGLAEAIKFPQTRIRFSDDRVPPPHIIGIEIVSPNERGFFTDLKIGFTENLNCIIGPRGSGKSTVVDAFRYVFGYNRNLQEFENKDLVEAVKNRQQATLTESRIRIFYRLAEGTVQILEATYDPRSDYATKVFTLDGRALPVHDIGQTNDYPIRLFGWSEIETLGRNPQRQLELLDRLIEGLAIWQKLKKSLKDQLELNRKEISPVVDELRQITQRNNSEIRRYQEYKDEFERLNTIEVQALFEDLDQERAHASFVEKYQAEIGNLHKRVTDISFAEIEDLEADASTNLELMSWWSVIKQQLKTDQIPSTLKQDISKVASQLDDYSTLIGKLQEQLEEKSTEIEGQIRSKVSADPTRQILADLRRQAKERLDVVEKLRTEYRECYEKFDAFMKTRRSLLQELWSNHKKISELRLIQKQEIEIRLNEFQTVDMKISLQFEKDGNKEPLLSYLNGASLLTNAHRQFRSRKWPEIISGNFLPIQFAQAILCQRITSIAQSFEIENKLCEIDQDEAEKLLAACYPYSHDDLADIDCVDGTKLEFLLNLQEVDWDDSERIFRNEQPIDRSSPGQRSSAMLPLIALSESVPLLIDQPEDNLDNRLVGRVLVEILAKLKEKRQIIVATHNPNIVVLGDSEQVIVLDALDDKQGCVKHQASIDDSTIIRTVVDLMEGGKAAFDTRSTRYTERT